MRRRIWGLSVLTMLAGAGVFIALRGTGTTAPAPVQSTEAADLHTWPSYQYNASHNAVLSAGALRANWLAKLGDRINGGLAVVDGTVYAVSFDKSLYAIDEATGSIRWSARTDNVL